MSVLVPAFNEELVIKNTISSLLASEYQDYEIIVVDDGSVDRTSEIVRENFSGDKRVRLFSVSNAGKATALNLGLKHATGDVVIALDADTLFAPQTIGALAHRFLRSEDGRRGGKRQGWQSHKHRDALAGA